MKLLDRLFHRSRHAAPRMLTRRQARHAAARLAEANAALPTVVERDRAATLAHLRAHWRVEDADTQVMPRAAIRDALEAVDDPPLVRPYVQAGWYHMQGSL